MILAGAISDGYGVRAADVPDSMKAWRDLWSAGHGVSLIDDVPTTAELVARLETEYRAAC